MSNCFRFLSTHHIRDKATFNAVFNSRRLIRSPFGVLRYVRNELDCARLGVISSKKNVRFAVRRNQLRRIIREQFRLHQSVLSGYDVVFIVYKQANTVSKSDFHTCLDQLLDRLAGQPSHS